jgi:glycosyl transferase family 25
MKSFYINLDVRTDRRAEFEYECTRMNLTAERFPAIQTFPGLSGCSQSHLTILKLARERNDPEVIIFEDDFEFLISRDQFQSVLLSLPENYDVVMLGYNLVRSEPHDKLFGKALEIQTTSGYIVHSRFYDTLITRWEEGLALLHKHDWDCKDSKYMLDQYWKPLQPVSNWYYTLTRVGRQRGSWSNIYDRYVDYGV